MTLLFGNVMAFNFTVICMLRPDNTSSTAAGYPNIGGGGYYDYTPLEKNLLFSAVALGCLLSSPPMSYMISRFGIKQVLLTHLN